MNIKLLLFLWLFHFTSSENSCGKPVRRGPRILGGPRVTHGAFPWNAALVINDDVHICGGTLVSKNEVITAAHCIQSKQLPEIVHTNDFKVVFGYHNLSDHNETGRISSTVKKIRVHPDWIPNMESYDADIAILELEQEVPLSDYIQPICISQPASIPSSISNGAVVAFGIDDHGIEHIPRIVDISLKNYKKCSKDTNFSPYLSHRTFCGEHIDGTGLCSGDDGSGLIVLHENTYYLRGIVSSTILNVLTGCKGNANSIFTDVTKFYGWITHAELDDCSDAKMLQLVEELAKENRELRKKLGM